jgi:hypothetical protein
LQIQNPVIVICIAVDYLGSNPEKAMQICLNETPFSTGGGEGALLYTHPCLLQVACKTKPANYTMAVKVCQAMEQAPLQEGDQNISGQKCVSYIDGNC